MWCGASMNWLDRGRTMRRAARRQALRGPISANDPNLGDRNAAISPDGQVLVFNRSMGPGNLDLFYARRSGDDFIDPVPMPFNTANDDGYPAWSPDGSHLYYTYEDGTNLHVRIVPVTGTTFGDPIDDPQFATFGYLRRPRFTQDGTDLFYFATQSGRNDADIFHATRLTATSAIWAKTVVPELSTSMVDTTPTLASDDLTIYFTSTRFDGTSHHIYQSHRAGIGAAWEVPTDLGDFGLNGLFAPDISHDGTIMLVSGYLTATADIYELTRTCHE
jgi:Tol biopolymer transport system component